MRDKLFDTTLDLVNWTFNTEVANVFDDMVLRSVPSYRSMLEIISLISNKYTQNNTNLYDLGCSTGAVSLALNTTNKNSSIIAVDNSQAMVDKCRENLKNIDNLTVICDDIENIAIKNASVVVLNLTLQFIKPKKRQNIIDKIYTGLKPNGVLVISEKVSFSDNNTQNLITNLHLDFKKANGYSELEIANKRQMLENVLISDDSKTHLQRLKNAGFKTQTTILQNLNFKMFLAIREC
jgi:tRNA (cmo5U34)-methyltransferase